MSKQLRDTIYEELSAVTLIDPHTHINALQPASETLADILGYHYYTELAHSAGLERSAIEEPGLDPKEKVARLMDRMGAISNTIQYSWFVEMAQALLGLEGDEINADNWESLYDSATEKMAGDGWADEVLKASKLDGVFLTNDFDDPLEGFDTKTYIPCLRTDDLVFHLAKYTVRERFEKATGHAADSVASLTAGIGVLFDHFAKKGAKACAISLPPDFAPTPVSQKRAATALAAIVRDGVDAAETHRRAIGNYVFWTLAQRCADYRLPFDLMIGVNRGVYEEGVFQGQDLYDSRVSLIQYKRLFNAFPQVTFPISVLASVTNQELTSYAWIFPNVVTNGHWWYSNTPTYIEHDASARLEAVPRGKQIGYYSDMYKLEFALPKFNMYKRILSKILAERFVIDRQWSEARAIEFGLEVLRDNSERIFKVGSHDAEPYLPPPELMAVEPAADSADSADSADMSLEPSGGADEFGMGIAAGAIGGSAALGAAEASGLDLDSDNDDTDVEDATPTIDMDGESPTIDMEESPAVAMDGASDFELELQPAPELDVEPGAAATVDSLDDEENAPTIDLDDSPTIDMDSGVGEEQASSAFALEEEASPDADTLDGTIELPLEPSDESSDEDDDLKLDIDLDDPPSDPDEFKLDL